MTLIPSDWEPLDHEVGPFGPEELQVLENTARDQPIRSWLVRLTARQDEESVAKSWDPPTCDLNDVDDIKNAIAHRLNALISKSFDKDKDLLPGSFGF